MHRFLCALLLTSPLFSQPEGFKLISGNATSHLTEVTSVGNTCIEWEHFSIHEHETFRFSQDSAKSSVLNRVTGPLGSEIFGQLHSNGQVILVNPHGIVIGPNARIDTAGLIASSLDLDNHHVGGEGGRLFSGQGTSGIVHLGHIEASGDVFLLGPVVKNEGTIRAEHVGIGVGHSILIKPEGSQRVFIQASTLKGEEEEGAALEHSGLIEALRVEMRSSPGPYAKAISCSGVIDANRVEERGGEIHLVAEEGVCEVAGSLRAQGIEGGSIQVLGDTVHLYNGTKIDASGNQGGGEILIGGDYQGKNPDVKNAKYVWAGSETLVQANSVDQGNGGKVIFWSDEATFHYGKIDISGGERGGDGGLAEVSGKILEYRGFTNGAAPFGKVGTLLLDPNDIVIGASATTGSFTGCGSPPSTYTITSGTATNQILNTDLNSQLSSCNVSITTVGSGGSGPNGGSITVSSAVTWATTSNLTLTANTTMDINASVTCTSGGGAIALTANSISKASGVSITTVGSGTINLTATTEATGGAFLAQVDLRSGTVGAANGTITINSVAATTTRLGIYLAGTIQTSGSGNIVISGISHSNVASGGEGFYAETGSRVTAAGSGSIQITGVGATGASATSGNGIGIQTTALISTQGGDLTLNGTGSTSGASSGVAFIGPISSTSGTIRVLGTASVTNPGISVTSSGSVSSTTGDIFIGGRFTGTSAAAGISLGKTNPVTSSSGNITLSGTSSGTSAGSHGITVTSSWTTGTSGTVTFGATVTDGVTSISGCTGGSGSGSHGLNMGAAFSTAGHIVATNLIRGGTGSGSIGFVTGSNFATTGSGKNITITATTQATAGTAHGISITGGTFTTNSGTITLTGTAGTSTTASYGINQAVAISNPGSIAFTGTAGGDASSYGTAIGGNLTATIAGSTLAISGSSLLTGTRTLDTTNSGGNSGGNITITGSISGAQALTLRAGSNGAITLADNVGAAGTRLTGLTFTSGSGLTLGNSSTNSSIYTTGVTFAPGMAVTLAGNETIDTNISPITFSSTINNNGSGPYNLTLNAGGAGTGGAITLSGAIGGSIAINALSVATGASLALGDNISAASVSVGTGINTTLSKSGTTTITTSGASGISFVGTINGTSSGAQALTLTAGANPIALSGVIGGSMPLGAFTCTGSSIALPTTTTTAGGAIQMNGPVVMSGGVALDSTNGGGTPAGANIAITGAVTGAHALSIRAGSNGAITFGSTVGTGVARLTGLTLTSGLSLSLGGNVFLNANPTIPMQISLTADAIIDTGP